MALGDPYITRDDLKLYMGLETDEVNDVVDDAIASASREINKFCHRTFHDAGSVSARVFRPLSLHAVYVDDFSTSIGLVVEADNDGDGVFEQTWADGDYELTPLNGVVDGESGWPYTRIVAVGYSKRFRLTRRTNVRVTARWGWAEVPDLVVQACKILASDTFQLKDSRMGIAGSDQFGQIVRVRDNQMAQNKLRHYARNKVIVR